MTTKNENESNDPSFGDGPIMPMDPYDYYEQLRKAPELNPKVEKIGEIIGALVLLLTLGCFIFTIVGIIIAAAAGC